MNEVREIAERFAADLVELQAELAEWESGDSETDSPVWEWLNDALEVAGEWRGATRDEATLHAVRVLVSFGGPNVWAVSDGRGVNVEAHWWGESAAVYVPAEGVAAVIFDAVTE